MYTPAYHAFSDIEKMHAHLAEHALGAWVCNAHGQLIANHIPFVLEVKHGSHVRPLAHVSRANPVWRELVGGAPSVVLFMGPSAYITPSWYPGKRQHGKVVPTWNYVTVHAHGVASAMEDIREAKKNAPNVQMDPEALTSLKGRGDGYLRDRSSPRARRVQVRPLD